VYGARVLAPDERPEVRRYEQTVITSICDVASFKKRFLGSSWLVKLSAVTASSQTNKMTPEKGDPRDTDTSGRPTCFRTTDSRRFNPFGAARTPRTALSKGLPVPANYPLQGTTMALVHHGRWQPLVPLLLGKG
jgi:hypothetical protein